MAGDPAVPERRLRPRRTGSRPGPCGPADTAAIGPGAGPDDRIRGTRGQRPGILSRSSGAPPARRWVSHAASPRSFVNPPFEEGL